MSRCNQRRIGEITPSKNRMTAGRLAPLQLRHIIPTRADYRAKGEQSILRQESPTVRKPPHARRSDGGRYV